MLFQNDSIIYVCYITSVQIGLIKSRLFDLVTNLMLHREDEESLRLWYGKTPLRRKRHRNADAEEVILSFDFFFVIDRKRLIIKRLICYLFEKNRMNFWQMVKAKRRRKRRRRRKGPRNLASNLPRLSAKSDRA